jgi:hypothetical protein
MVEKPDGDDHRSEITFGAAPHRWIHCHNCGNGFWSVTCSCGRQFPFSTDLFGGETRKLLPYVPDILYSRCGNCNDETDESEPTRLSCPSCGGIIDLPRAECQGMNKH